MQLKANLHNLQERINASFQEGGLSRRVVDNTRNYIKDVGQALSVPVKIILIWGVPTGIMVLATEYNIQRGREAQAYEEVRILADSNHNKQFDVSEQLDVLKRAGYDNIQLVGPHGRINLPGLSLEDFERVKTSYLNEQAKIPEQQVAEK